jgi:hypothetical protein
MGPDLHRPQHQQARKSPLSGAYLPRIESAKALSGRAPRWDNSSVANLHREFAPRYPLFVEKLHLLRCANGLDWPNVTASFEPLTRSVEVLVCPHIGGWMFVAGGTTLMGLRCK